MKTYKDGYNKIINGRTIKEYRKDNIETISQKQKAYREAHKEETMKQQQREYQEANKETIKERKLVYYGCRK